MKLTRRDDWPEQLGALIEERAFVPFVWGVNDCALFACDAIQTTVGIDVAAPFRGRYDSAASASAAMLGFIAERDRPFLEIAQEDRQELLEHVAEIIAAEHELREVEIPFARRGDAVLFEGEHGATLGVVGMDGMTIVAPGPTGLLARPLAEARRAWRV